MLYVKLTLRNIRSGVKEYSLFMMTMSMSMMLMYAFFAIAVSERILALINTFVNFLPIVILTSSGVMLILSWLIMYITKFMMKKRSKEFGLYLLSGMKRRNVAAMFLWEQWIMGLAALGIGILLGSLLSQLFEAIFLQLFEVPYEFTIGLSTQACGFTFVFFVGIYVLEAIKVIRWIKKSTLHDILSDDRKHETLHVSKRKGMLLFFFGCVLFLISVLVMLLFQGKLFDLKIKGGINLIVIGILSMILSIYLFYFGLSQCILLLLQTWKTKKYKGNSLFLSTQLASKVKTNRMVLATLSMLSILIISMLVLSMQLKVMYDELIQKEAPFDIMAYSSETIEKQRIMDQLHQKGLSYRMKEYEIYTIEEGIQENLVSLFQDSVYEYSGRNIYYMKESAVRDLLKLKQKELPRFLSEKEYAILTTPEVKDLFQEGNPRISFQGTSLSCAYFIEEAIGQQIYVDHYVVLPDAYFTQATIKNNVLVIDVDGVINESFYKESKAAVNPSGNGFYLYRVKPYYIKNQLSIYAMSIFSILYVCMIAICISATMIATQQLSDRKEQRYAYQILSRMGLSQTECKKLLFQQVLFYFLIPFLPLCLYLPMILKTMQSMLSVSFPEVPLAGPLFVALGLVFIIYGCYFWMTYIGCKRNIAQER